MSHLGIYVSGTEQRLLTQLARVNQAAIDSSLRLATGNIVNAPSDDPSAFLQVSLLEQQLSQLSTTQANVDLAANVGAEAQTTLDEIRTQLNTIRSLLVEDENGTLTAAQRVTNQAAIDTAINTIRDLARTSINGKRYLDGSFNYTTSGRISAQIRDVQVYSLSTDTAISGTVTSAATQTQRRYTGGSGNINSGNATFTLTGRRGSTSISVTNGEALTAVRDRINLDSHLTGITTTVSGNNLNFLTVDYGADATITATATSGTFSTSSIATGVDAGITINGTAVSSANIDGNLVSFSNSTANITLEIAAGFSGAFTGFTVADNSVASFSLSSRISQLTKLGLPGVFPELLGGVSGFLSNLSSGGTLAGLNTNAQAAIRVVDESLEDLSAIEGRVNAFADTTVASASNLLSALQTHLEDAIDALNQVDEDEETLVLAKAQSLGTSAISSLALLAQQRTSTLELLQLLAGTNS